jgi:WD40 repeat protein
MCTIFNFDVVLFFCPCAALGAVSFKEYRLHAGACSHLCVSRDGSWAATAGRYDGTVVIWKVQDAQPAPAAPISGMTAAII